jgi:hypothetical protein
VTRLMQIRLWLAGIGIAIWGYGYAVDDANVRWVGIGFLAVSVALRFYPKRDPNGSTPT